MTKTSFQPKVVLLVKWTVDQEVEEPGFHLIGNYFGYFSYFGYLAILAILGYIGYFDYIVYFSYFGLFWAILGYIELFWLFWLFWLFSLTEVPEQGPGTDIISENKDLQVELLEGHEDIWFLLHSPVKDQVSLGVKISVVESSVLKTELSTTEL